MVAPLVWLGTAISSSPAVSAVIAGAGAQAAYAWWDPDLFNRLWVHGDTDEQVATLNNYWQQLWRSGVTVLPVEHAYMKRLGFNIDGWDNFRVRYNESIFRRAVDPFAVWGAQKDFERELTQVWLPRFDKSFREFVALDPRIQQGLQARGVDPEPLLTRALEPTARTWGLYLGLGLAVSLLAAGAVLARRVPRVRRAAAA